MGLPTPMAVSVTPPELVGIVLWWGVILTAPVILVRCWKRRRDGVPRRSLLRLGMRSGWSGTIDVGRAPRPLSPGARPDHTDFPSQSATEAKGQRPRPGNLAASDLDMRQERKHSPAGRQPAARLTLRTLEPLCRYVDFRRRLELAVRELEAKLSQLPAERWRIEPYPLTGERRNTLLILGETGVFVMSATYAPGHWDDVIAVNKLARKVQLLLPGYSGKVQPAICHPFTPKPPRLWHRAGDNGDWIRAWLLGGDSVIEWLEHFGAEHGLSPADLERFDEISKPNWLKAAIPTPPSWPPIQATAPSGSQE